MLLRFRITLILLCAVPRYFLYVIIQKVRHKKKLSQATRILVMPQLTRVGDVVCTTPVFRAIKKHSPQSHVAVFVGPKIVGILKNNPHIDQLIIFEPHEYTTFWGPLHAARKIRSQNFDACVNLSGNPLGTFLSVWANIPLRVKITRTHRAFSESISDWMNSNRIRYRVGEYLPSLYLRTLEALSIFEKDVAKQVFTSPAAEKKADIFLRDTGIGLGDVIVGMSISAGNSIKEWPTENFVALAQHVIEKHRAFVVLIGAPGEKDRLLNVKKLIPGNVVVASDFLLEELPSLMKRFQLFVAADTGPIHVAHALVIPLIDIIGPVDPSEQAPRND